MMCVIKGDAFGHGAVPVARVLEDAGADYLAVALPEEALQLRRAGIKTPIMILDIADSAWIAGFDENDITATVGSFESAFNYEKSMTNSICRMQLKVHISINTGMNRIGLQPEDAADQITQIKRECSHLQIEGIWTHFAEAGSEGDSGCFTAGQYEKFQNVVKQLEERNVCFPYVHCANSDAIVTCGEGVLSGTNMARPGNLLYGAIDYSKYGITLKPAILPFLVFLICAVMSMATGTSWGSMAIVMPLALPLAIAFEPSQTMIAVVSTAVVAGSIFGDHCSPISDTTLMASIGAASDHIDHFKTQMPYGFTVAVVSGIMYLCVGKASPFVILIAGAILLAVLIYALHKVSVKKYGFEKDTMKELLKQEA